MKQNTLYLIIGALVVVVIALGIYVYHEETKPDGVELKIDDRAFRSSRIEHFGELLLPLQTGRADALRADAAGADLEILKEFQRVHKPCFNAPLNRRI